MFDLYEKIGYCGVALLILGFAAVFTVIRGTVLSVMLKKQAVNRSGIIKEISLLVLKNSGADDNSYINSLMQTKMKGLFSSLYFLKLCAAVGPLLGLLGTVLGMIEVFSTLADNNTPNSALLASGIWQALITTVMGLTLAIPALMVHYYILTNLRYIKTTITLLSRQTENAGF